MQPYASASPLVRGALTRCFFFLGFFERFCLLRTLLTGIFFPTA